MIQEGNLKIKGIHLKKNLIYGKIWPNLRMNDNHFGYITKLTTPPPPPPPLPERRRRRRKNTNGEHQHVQQTDISNPFIYHTLPMHQMNIARVFFSIWWYQKIHDFPHKI
jgi:hypothetical protein